jgi:ATP-binding cassette subfamily B protein
VADNGQQTADRKQCEEDQARESETRAPFGDAWLLAKSVWRTVRGDDDRGRKVRWLFGLLRPYRVRVFWMMVALVLATAAALAPPYLAGLAIDKGIGSDPPANSDLNALTLILVAFLA